MAAGVTRVHSDAPPRLRSLALSRMDWLSDCRRCFLGLFTVRLGRRRVDLGLFMLPLLVVIGRFHVVMGRYLMVRSRLKVLLDCF